MTTGMERAGPPMLAVGDRLPGIRLPVAAGESAAGEAPARERPLRGPHRDAVVVVALHDSGCAECGDYLRRLADAGDRFRLWDGTVLALTDDAAGATGAGLPVDVLVDADRGVLDRLDTVAGPAVGVADRFGQLFHVRSGVGHALPEPRELEEWLQYLATQCPE